MQDKATNILESLLQLDKSLIPFSTFWNERVEDTLEKYHFDGFGVKERPWGRMKMLEKQNAFWVKILEIDKGQRISLQSHEHRDEVWLILNGMAQITVETVSETYVKGQIVFIYNGMKHRAKNIGKTPLLIIEIATGNPHEGDIIRFEDDYERENECVSC